MDLMNIVTSIAIRADGYAANSSNIFSPKYFKLKNFQGMPLYEESSRNEFDSICYSELQNRLNASVSEDSFYDSYLELECQNRKLYGNPVVCENTIQAMCDCQKWEKSHRAEAMEKRLAFMKNHEGDNRYDCSRILDF